MVNLDVAECESLTLLEHLARAGRRAAEAYLAPLDLRPRHLIVLTLLSDNGPTNQHGLAEALSLDASNVVGVLNELEDRGLISRRRDPSDRRRHIVELSDQGQEQLLTAQRLLARVEDDVLRALSPDERSELNALLVRATVGHIPADACPGADASCPGVVDEEDTCSA